MMRGSAEQKPFAVSAGIEKLRQPEESVRLAALGEILGAKAGAQALDQVAACLDDTSERVRCAAVVVLGEIGAAAAAALVRGLDEKQPASIRVLAASAAARLGDDAAPAINALIACLEAGDENIRLHAAFALGKIGGPAVPHLRKLLSNAIPAARIAAADALGYAGAPGAEALPDLTQIIQAESPAPLRLACAAAALKISVDSKDALAMMLQTLEVGDEPTRVGVIEKLGESRSNAGEAASAVVKFLLDESAKIRANAALALGRIGTKAPEVISALVPLLADGDPAVRLNTAIALSAFGAEASQAAAALRHAQQDPDPRVAAAATATIERIRSEGG